MTRFTRYALVALVLISCVGCDQISKSAARHYLPGTGVRSFLSDTFRLEYAQNPGAFLSLGESLSPAVRYDGFVLGGGNLIDRLRFDGTVTDFLNLGLGSLRTGIFNVADAILMLGAVVLLISARART